MRCSVELVRSRYLTRVASVALLASVSAGCSTDTMRFTDNPFSSPFDRHASTGSIPSQQPAPYQPVGVGPASPVASQPLPPVGMGDEDLGQGGYGASQPAYRSHAPQGIAASPRIVSNVKGGWSNAGGATVTARAGESVHTLSNRYGIPASAIMSANGLQSPTLSPGQQVIIPVFSTAHAPARAPNPLLQVPPRAAPVTQVSMKPVRVIPITHEASGRSQKKPSLVLAQGAQPKMVKSVLVTNSPDAAQKPQRPPKPVAATPPMNPGTGQAATAPVFSSNALEDDPGAPENVGTVPASQQPAATAAAEPATRGGPEFRWPVRGRVIQAFGQTSQGINISVPEGTEVKAAESGVVAYAGSELKAYGNLILVRHADGYVTAYAHAKNLTVKKGDTIKRGQVIATAGQTGNVTSPQLLFELRKGATPVDPRDYLPGT